jgi:hypothetical protein
MRAPLNRSRVRLIAVVVGALAPFIVAGSSLSGAHATAHPARHATPRLRLADRNPATVRGTGFRARSHIRVTLTAGQKFVRRLTASRQGAFTVAFPTAVDRCTVWSVSATPERGASVMLHGAKPECPPA